MACLYHQRPDMVMEFIKSLDKDHEMSFSDNLFLICAHSFDIPLNAKDIIRMAKTFEFENKNYIKKYPELFEQTMTDVILNKCGSTNVNLRDYITPTEFKKIKSENIRLFANVSLIDHHQIKVPVFADNFKLKKNMYDILEATHEEVKSKLPELRKKGELESTPQEKTPKKILLFDQPAEKELLEQLRKFSKEPVQRHFTYIALQDFYYKFRNLGDSYLDKCIEYCMTDINTLDALQRANIQDETANLKRLSDIYSKPELQN